MTVSSEEVTPKPENTPVSESRRPSAGKPSSKKPFPRWAIGGVLLVGLLAGAAGGALVARQHYRAKDVLISVNGKIITRKEYQARLDAATKGSVLYQMVAEELEKQYAQKKGLMPPDADVKARYDKLAAQPDFIVPGGPLPLSVPEMQNLLQVQMAANAVASQGVKPTDQQVQDYYKLNTDPKNPKARFYIPETVRVQVIVTSNETQASQAMKLLDANIAFEDVARKFSQDASRQQGGLLPPVERGRSSATRIPGLEDAMFFLKPGQNAGPNKYGQAWWIIHSIDKRPAITQKFDAVKDECRDAVAVAQGLTKPNQARNDDMLAFRQKAVIKAFDPRYAAMFPKGTP